MRELLIDPSNHLTAVVLEWDHPVSREWAVLTDLYDAFGKAHFKKPKPYPRPWHDRARRGRTTLSPEEAKRVLARLAGR